MDMRPVLASALHGSAAAHPPAAARPAAATAAPPIDRVDRSSAASAPAPAAPAASPRRAWQDEILYFIMVDRFANGNRGNDRDADPRNAEKFHGGDWQGVIDHLDDLDKLGVTTLWLSPPYLNDDDFLGMQGYHGYWVHDFYKPDPHLGDMEKLRELVDKAHQRGMKVILDVIVNHTGYNHPWVKDPAHQEWFHHEGNINALSWTEGAMEKRSLRGLPDLAQENPQVSRYLIDNAKWWAQQTGIDGFRVDAVKHVPRSWLQTFADEMHKTFGPDFFMVGEAYSGSADRIAAYQKDGHLDSLFDFPLSNAVRCAIGYDDGRGEAGVISDAASQIFAHPLEAAWLISQPHGDMRILAESLRHDKSYAHPEMIATMVDNHDMRRFASLGGSDARKKLKLALTFLLTTRGVPCIYQGTEDGQGLHGEGDRDDKKWGRDPELAKFVAKLTHLRRDSVALRRGETQELAADRNVLAFARVHPDEQAVVALNRSDEPQARDLEIPAASGLRDGDVLVDALSGKKFTVHQGHLQVGLPPRGSLVLRHA